MKSQLAKTTMPPEVPIPFYLTEEQTKGICEVVESFDASYMTTVTEDIAQQLLNNIDNVSSEVGEQFYTLRMMKDLFVKLFPLFKCVHAIAKPTGIPQ